MAWSRTVRADARARGAARGVSAPLGSRPAWNAAHLVHDGGCADLAPWALSAPHLEKQAAQAPDVGRQGVPRPRWINDLGRQPVNVFCYNDLGEVMAMPRAARKV